ncbi:pirin [Streptomyces abyssalis]|uniref:Pirin n=1 Tax=Streptomyces abyssalis TaxID=933944 RepID=A0A1E7JK96_9ACTN|nr:pirin family protein [Streptomyces abyssalis]OEU88068.1 pirin [Streptomyces abyssalis]OEU90937.1 pirin [Streptomyces abyssalis]
MLQVWRGSDRYRGGDEDAGIDTRHAFSFSGFYDPDNVGFGQLVACNEERLAPGAGFPEHPHRDVEIVTWVVEGELEHIDSTGRTSRVSAGDVQRMGAGRGVRHVERNAGTGPLCFVQMWLVPGFLGTASGAGGGGAGSAGSGQRGSGDRGYPPGGEAGHERGHEPEYEVVHGIADGTPFAVPRTEAVMHVRRLGEGERTAVPDAAWVYVHVVRGTAEIGPAPGERLAAGDAARITDARDLEARGAGGPVELLMWEMHAEPEYGG